MKKWIPLLVICLLAFSNHAFATHIVGAEITYKPTSTTGVIEVHLVVFRNCDGGIEMCSGTCGTACTQSLSILGVDPGFQTTSYGGFTASLVNVRDIKDNQSAAVKNTCKNMTCASPGTFTPGIERYEFVGFANIGLTSGIHAACCNIRIEWSQSVARNSQIATGSANQNFYINAIVNRCQFNTTPNASPAYTYDPIVMHCGGQSLMYHMGAAYDPDGDSLSYAFAPSKQAYNTSVTYTLPWSHLTPMPFSGADTTSFPGGIHCDPATGIISYTPNNTSGFNFYGVICIEIKQWKTIAGVPTVVGITYRDFQNIVLANCPANNPPSITSDPSNPFYARSLKFDWVFPAGVQTCLSLMAHDTDYLPPTLSDTVIIDTVNAFSNLGGQFTRFKPIGSFREDSMRFCWTPPVSRQSNSPYVLTVKARDSRKPLEGKVSFALKIYVPFPIEIASVSDSALTCTTKRFSYKIKPSSATPGRTDWSVRKIVGSGSVLVDSIVNQHTMDYAFADTGLFKVTVYAFSSATSPIVVSQGVDTLRVINTAVKAIGTDTVVCKYASSLLGVNIIGGKAPFRASWRDGLNQYPGLTRLVTVGDQNKTLTVTVIDSVNCSFTDTVQVSVYKAPVLSIRKIADTVQCESTNQFKFFNNAIDTGIPGMSYTWLLDNSTIGSTDTIQFSVIGTGQHILRLRSVTPQGCRDSVETKLYLFSSPKAAFVLSDTATCKTGTFTCTNQSSIKNGSFACHWDVGFAQSAATNFTFTATSAGKYTVKLFAYNTLSPGCNDTLWRNVYVYPKPTLTNTINTVSACLKQNEYVFTNTSVTDSTLQYSWLIDGDTSTAMVVKKSFSAAGIKTIKFRMTSRYGCNDSLTKTVTVLPSPTASFTINDTNQCMKGNRFVFTNTTSGAASGTFLFDNMNPVVVSPVTKVYPTPGRYIVALIAAHANNCKDTAIRNIEVRYSPAASILLSDSVFCKYQSITCTSTALNSAPVATLWSFSDQAIDSGVTVAKRFNALGLQKVTLRVVTDRGCADSITRSVIVNNTPPTPVVTGPLSVRYDSVVTYSTVSNPALTYDWLIENGSFVSGNLHTHTVDLKWNNSAANGRLYAFTHNASGCASDTTRFDVSIIGGVGLNQVAASFQNLLVFPNPTTDAITVSLSSLSAQRIQITVFNIVGTQVKTATYDSPKGIFTEQINLHDLQKGMYLMHIEGETGSQVVKLFLK